MIDKFKRLSTKIIEFVVIKCLTEGGKNMMAMLFAQRVILGKTSFDEVPASLKAGVAEVLLDSGLPELVPAEFGGTAQ